MGQARINRLNREKRIANGEPVEEISRRKKNDDEDMIYHLPGINKVYDTAWVNKMVAICPEAMKEDMRTLLTKGVKEVKNVEAIKTFWGL